MVRFGILGAGNIARRFAASLAHETHAELVAVSRRSEEKAREFLDQNPCAEDARAFGSHEALLADPAVDAIYLALPHDLHREWAIAALRAGKAVLCEKPACVSEVEMREVAEVARDEGRLFMEAMKPRFTPTHGLVYNALPSIGELVRVEATLCNDMLGMVEGTGTYHMTPGPGAGVLLETVAAQAGAGELCYGEKGKPFFAQGGVHFNLSHSGHYAVCAVSDKPVGVDIETVRVFSESLVRHVFDSGERAFAQGSDERFTQLWTIKESVMKFFGQGVGISPKKISIGFEPRVCVTTEGYDCGGLRFCGFAGQDFALTVCSQSEEFCKGVTQVCIGEDFELQTSGFDGAKRVY